MNIPKDPTPETIAQRLAIDQEILDHAAKGDPICGGAAAMMAMAESSGFYINDTYRDEDEDDDIRPF